MGPHIACAAPHSVCLQLSPSSDYPSAQLSKIGITGGPNERAISIVPFTTVESPLDSVRPGAFVKVLSPASVAPRFVHVWLTLPEKNSFFGASLHSVPVNSISPSSFGIVIVS